jgi:hypothetical protein
MNAGHLWEQTGFQYIISDSVKKHFDQSEAPALSCSVIPHVSARGSNALIGCKILTVLSNINKSGIEELEAAHRSMGGNMPREELEAMFYADRIRQSISRAVGFRNSESSPVEAFLWVHSGIWKKLEPMIQRNHRLLPFTVRQYSPDCSFLPVVLANVEQLKAEQRETARQVNASKLADDRDIITERLDEVFICKPESSLSYADIHAALEARGLNSLNGRKMRASRVASHFNLTPAVTATGDRSSRRKVRSVPGLSLRTSTINNG